MNWDKRYSEGDTPWDHGFAAPSIEEVIVRAEFSDDAEVLVPGCGRGYDVRAFASAGYAATGLDLSAVVIDECQALTNVDGGGEICFFQGDLFNPVLPRRKRYDVIWEHTCFCTFPQNLRSAYVEAVYRLLKPRGLFVGLFFTDTGKPPEVGPPFSVDQEVLQKLFSPHFSLQWEQKPNRTYESRIDRE